MCRGPSIGYAKSHVGRVVFVTAAEKARQGIETANAHAGQTFADRFGEVCTVE